MKIFLSCNYIKMFEELNFSQTNIQDLINYNPVEKEDFTFDKDNFINVFKDENERNSYVDTMIKIYKKKITKNELLNFIIQNLKYGKIFLKFANPEEIKNETYINKIYCKDFLINFNKEKDKFLFMNSILLFISLCISNKKNINISNLELDILNKENISYDDIKLLFIKNYFILCEGKNISDDLPFNKKIKGNINRKYNILITFLGDMKISELMDFSLNDLYVCGIVSHDIIADSFKFDPYYFIIHDLFHVKDINYDNDIYKMKFFYNTIKNKYEQDNNVKYKRLCIVLFLILHERINGLMTITNLNKIDNVNNLNKLTRLKYRILNPYNLKPIFYNKKIINNTNNYYINSRRKIIPKIIKNESENKFILQKLKELIDEFKEELTDFNKNYNYQIRRHETIANIIKHQK